MRDTPIEGTLVRCDARFFAGYAFDPAEPHRTLVVEILLDGLPVKLLHADGPVPRLEGEASHALHGFEFALEESRLADNAVIEARLANTHEPVGMPIRLAATPLAGSRGDLLPPSKVESAGRLRFTGWVRAGGQAQQHATVRAAIEGQTVATARCTRWTHIGSRKDFEAGRMGFDIHLPERFGDGQVRTVRFFGPDGELRGSPLDFVAYADGMRRFLQEASGAEDGDPRAELVDRVLPRSLPLSQYETWRTRFPPPVPEGAVLPVGLLLIGEEGIDETRASLAGEEGVDWLAAGLAPLPGGLAFEADACRRLLDGDLRGRAIVVLARVGARFNPGGLRRLVGALLSEEEAVAAYADFEVAGADGRRWPVLLSAFDGERLMEQGQGAQLLAVRTEALKRCLDNGAASSFAVLLALSREAKGQHILHVPCAVALLPMPPIAEASERLASDVRDHLRARGLAGRVVTGRGALLPAARVVRAVPRGRVEIIIPTRDRLDLLEPCIAAIAANTRGVEHRVTVVDNASREPETLRFLADFAKDGGRVIRADRDFNYSALNNLAVRRSDAPFVCLLNNDIEVIDPDWLRELLSRAADPETGAVGAQLTWPSGVVQHGGVVLGTSFAATHAFNDRMEGEPAYADLLRVAHQCSAVTAACLLLRRSDYWAVGGLDETLFPVNFNDVDLCLKLRSRGRQVVFTPHTRIRHHESASRGRDDVEGRDKRFRRELANLRARWGATLADDPFYNPLLGLDPIPYLGLAWPPRSFAPRRNVAHQPRQVPPGMG